MGCMGMSMDDFCRCTPFEFYAAYDTWNDLEDRREQAAWERMRMQCLCTLQPYSQKQLVATDVMRFPWDDDVSEEGRVKSEEFSCLSGKDKLSREEVMARYREAKKRAGMN